MRRDTDDDQVGRVAGGLPGVTETPLPVEESVLPVEEALLPVTERPLTRSRRLQNLTNRPPVGTAPVDPGVERPNHVADRPEPATERRKAAESRADTAAE